MHNLLAQQNSSAESFRCWAKDWELGSVTQDSNTVPQSWSGRQYSGRKTEFEEEHKPHICAKRSKIHAYLYPSTQNWQLVQDLPVFYGLGACSSIWAPSQRGAFSFCPVRTYSAATCDLLFAFCSLHCILLIRPWFCLPLICLWVMEN